MSYRCCVPACLLVALLLLISLVPGPMPSLAQTSAPSNPAPASRPLASPKGVKASDCEYDDKIRVTWKGVSGATRYQVSRAANLEDPLDLICDIDARGAWTAQCDDTTASANVLYHYVVRAWSLFGGWTGYSTPDQGTRKGPKPLPPGNLEASDGFFELYVRVTWTGSKGFSKYLVGRAKVGVFPPTESWETASSLFNDDTAVCSDHYAYRVKGRDLCGQWSDYGSADVGYRLATTPPPPVHEEASICSYPDKVRISWDPAQCATYYALKRHTEPLPSTPRQEVYRGGASSFDDTDVDPGLPYFYWVYACNEAGCCPQPAFSHVVGRACPPPTNLEATDCTYPDRVLLTWSSVPNAVKYRIYRANYSGGTKSQLGDVDAPATSFDDIRAQVNRTSYYWVRTCFNAACTRISAFSQGATGEACCDSPAAPSNVEASDGLYPDKVHVTWDGVAGATYYEVYRSGSPGGTKTKLGSPTGTWFDDTGCTPGARYYYWLTACNDCDCSDYSVPDLGFCGSLPAGLNYTYVPLVLYD